MRKLFLWMSCIGAIMLILFSCKKESIDADTPQNPANEKLIPKIKSWLEEQKNGLSAVSAVRIDSLKLNLSYGEIRLEKYKDSKELIVIPVSAEYKSRNNSDQNPATYLVLVFENQDSITRGNIIQYISSNSQRLAPQNTFYKIFTYQNLDCSGQFTILSITDNFRYELKFENGKLRSVAEPTRKPNPNSGSSRVNECIDWYLQIWHIWSDGTVELISEVYVYTTCDGDCALARIVNGRSYGTNCNGGGGGGGNGVEYEYAVSRPWKWTIGKQINLFVIKSYETVSGVKVSYEPQGGHFTSIVHVNSYFETADPDYSWQELGNTVSIDNPRTAYSYTTGKAIHDPSGNSDPYMNSSTIRFSEAFP